MMNKLICITILVSVGVGAVIAAGPLQKTIDGVDNQLNRLGDNIEVRIENFVHPPAHQPRKHGLLSSAIRGVGRLLRNVTVNAGRFAKSTAGAVGQTISEANNRIMAPAQAPVIQPPPIIQPIIETVIPQSEPELQNNAAAQVEETQAPATAPVAQEVTQAAQEVVQKTATAEASSETTSSATEAATTQVVEVATEAAAITTEATPETTEATANEEATTAKSDYMKK